ncbi:MAG: PD40 domain-containing protein [Saprospiraceae bacterium]|nr:PD40 domain-containing protein [Saprospiraceae bacterium]
MLKFIQTLSIVLLSLQLSLSQNYPSFDKYWEPITESIIKENYFEAYELISQALQYRKMQDTLNYLAADCAYKLNAYSKAESHLRAVLTNDFGERHLENYKLLGEILMNLGRYGESSNAFKTYLPTLNEGTLEYDYINQRIKQAIWAKENNNNKDPLVKIRKVDNGINTPDNEFGAFLYNNSLYYSGLRKNNYKSKNEDEYKSSVFKIDLTNNQELTLDSGLVEIKNKAGNLSFSKDHTMLVYTSCKQLPNSTKLNCSIYLKKFTNGRWSNSTLLPQEVNLSGYSSTQATITEEGELYRIYYSSNRPGGVGGYDIWSSLYDGDGSCSTPENLSEINSPGDEYSPYYSAKSKSIFFSSNYHLGFGGLDIFKYSWKGKDSLKILNVGRAINSSYDEVGYTSSSDEYVSFVSSTRPGSEYLDQSIQACCYDIYKINTTPKTVDLIIRIKDRYDSLDITGSQLQLYDITEGDSLLSVVSLNDKALHTFSLIEGHKYKIVAAKGNYIGDSTMISTIDLLSYDPIKRDLYLTQGKQLEITTYERTTNFVLKGATVQVWDVDRNLVVGQFTKVDTNLFNFSIYKGRNYRLIASKPKYESDTIDLWAKDFSNENPVQRKMFLELSAIAELRRLLPIRLFFDNDLPNPKSESDTTDVLFSKIYNDYTAKKGIYITQFANILKGAARANAILEIDTFFDKEVKWNGDKFLIFLDKLSIIMEEGHSIDIFLKGYASPRAKSEYNQHLSSRRVVSIRNEFDYYQNGIFHPYIDNQSLKIKEIPFGESKASTDVSDSIEDTRNSIYSLKAAYERRVEILEILKGVDDVH